MKYTKKLTSLLLAGLMGVTALAGCSQPAKEETVPTEEVKKSYTIGVCQFADNEVLNASTEGFISYIKKHLDGTVKVNEKNANGDTSKCVDICNVFVKSEVDLIMANATPSLQGAYAATTELPIIGCSVTDYATALHIDDWKGYTELNITGTSDLPPIEQQASLFKELLPDAKTIGLLTNPENAVTSAQTETIKPLLKKLGYKTKEYTFTADDNLADAVKKACKECNAIYAPSDDIIAVNPSRINETASDKKIPVIVGSEGLLYGCGVAALSVDYHALGEKSAELAVKVLQGNADIGTIEIETVKSKKLYDADRAEALGIEIPDGFEKI